MRISVWVACSCFAFLGFAQTHKKPGDFSNTEKCLYEYLVNSNTIKPATSTAASFNILQKDSFFLFQENLLYKDTLKLQVHLAYTSKLLSAKCSGAGWSIIKKEYIIANK